MHYLVWLAISSFVVVATFLLSDIFAPFIVAFIIAYLLEPLVRWLTRKMRVSRTIAVAMILTGLIFTFLVSITYLLPLVYDEARLLVSKFPEYGHYLQDTAAPYVHKFMGSLQDDLAQKISAALAGSIKQLSSVLIYQLANCWNYTLATINFIASLTVTLLALFYLMRDWPKMNEAIMNLVPIKHRAKFDKFCQNINWIIDRYIKGQLNICLIFTIYYTIGLSLIGSPASILLGILSGLMIIIPFIGMPIALGLSLVIGYSAFGYDVRLLYILVLYLLGNLLEGGMITPKIIGDKIGLHPIWLIIAVLTGGQLLGIKGIILAVPMACIVKVLMQVLIQYYRSSKLYLE